MRANPPGWHILTPDPGQPNAPQITRAHDTLTLRHAQSAKSDFNKRQGYGVGYICLLGGDCYGLINLFKAQAHKQVF